ncbi:hypothetical protein IWX46DRAFT_601995 [Phyllosticta citricarpa]|uniref:Secreted protein n=1 Tax=Phyllosticta citricarpa TaxID=55181 RepID=A0ABR1MBJ3_9PEZI
MRYLWLVHMLTACCPGPCASDTSISGSANLAGAVSAAWAAQPECKSVVEYDGSVVQQPSLAALNGVSWSKNSFDLHVLCLGRWPCFTHFLLFARGAVGV